MDGTVRKSATSRNHMAGVLLADNKMRNPVL